MLSDHDLIEQLRAGMAPLRAPAELLERVRAEAAATSRPRRWRAAAGAQRRRLRPRAGVLALSASSLVAIAVGVGALLLTGPRTHRPLAGASTTPAPIRGRAPTLQQIQDEFAVLRRPQTAADRSARPVCPQPCRERYLPQMTRRMAILPNRSSLFLTVWQLRSPVRGAPAGSYRLIGLIAHPTRRGHLAAGATLTLPILTGDALSGIPSNDYFAPNPLWTSVVPDAVSRVRWTFSCPRGRPCGPAESTPVSVEVPAVNDVATARVPATAHQARGVSRVEWFGAGGRRLASFSSPADPATPFPRGGAPAASAGQASPGQIRDFLAKAKRGASGTFSVTYAVGVRGRGGTSRRLVVTAAQRPGMLAYRQTPSLNLSGPTGPPASHSYEVIDRERRNAKAGLYSCQQAQPSAAWSCQSAPREIGMGGLNELLGPYPPQSLLLGLQNATLTYTGVPAPPALKPEPVFLVTRGALRCLEFGARAHRVGSVCLEPSGMIATYDLPPAVAFGTYATATLRSYSPQAAASAFTLPARPTKP
jgi:hypothetical protein